MSKPELKAARHRPGFILVLVLAAVAAASCASVNKTVLTDKGGAPVSDLRNDDKPCSCGSITTQGDSVTHDPTIVREADTYWRFATGDGISLARSENLKDWETVPSVFPANPEWTGDQVPGSTNFWAPEVVYRKGEWRVYYSVSTFGSNRSAIGLVTCKVLDPASPDHKWVDQGMVLASYPGNDYNAIDPAVFSDAQGQDWLVWGSFWGGIKLHRLDSEGRMSGGEANPDEVPTIARRMSPPDAIEGGFVFVHQGWYYLFVSHDFCCRGADSDYHIVVGRSRSPEGPYQDKDGRDMDMGGGTTIRDGEDDPVWAGPGHNSVFSDRNGKDYLVYHAYSRAFNGVPILQIDLITWDSDGWPLVPSQLNKKQAE